MSHYHRTESSKGTKRPTRQAKYSPITVSEEPLSFYLMSTCIIPFSITFTRTHRLIQLPAALHQADHQEETCIMVCVNVHLFE